LTRIGATIAALDTLRATTRWSSLRAHLRAISLGGDKVEGDASIARRAVICERRIRRE
jgi:hypothetical protein